MLADAKKTIVLLQGNIRPEFFARIVGKNEKKKKYFVLEGRPDLKASRRTCRELLKRKIKPTLIADNMAGFLFFKNMVQEVCLAYQTFDKTGAVCEIGALILAVLGKHHKVTVKFFPGERLKQFVAKDSTIFQFQKKRVAPLRSKGYVPLAEWVPQKYITEVVS